MEPQFTTRARPLLWKALPIAFGLLAMHVWQTQELLLLFASGLIAGAAVSAAAGRYFTRYVRVKVFWPESVHAGTNHAIRMLVSNAGYLPIPPIAVGAAVDGTADSVSSLAPIIPSDETAEVEVQLAFKRRGVFKHAHAELECSVLGFFSVKARWPVPASLVVHPRVWLIPGRNLGPGSPFTALGLGILPLPGHDVEFLGVREYVVGDSPRLIHWRTSARRDKLFVKEMARSSRADVTLFLDLGAAGPWTPDTAEDIVTAVASTVHLFRDLHLRYQLMVSAADPVHIRFGLGPAHYLNAMHLLTRVAPGGKRDAAAVLRSILSSISRPNALLVFSAYPTAPFLDLLEAVSASGVPVALVTPWLRNLPPEVLASGPAWEPVGPGGRELRFPVFRYSTGDELKNLLEGLR